jgi:hypothetical protein
MAYNYYALKCKCHCSGCTASSCVGLVSSSHRQCFNLKIHYAFDKYYNQPLTVITGIHSINCKGILYLLSFKFRLELQCN